jgi:hypothetical protein
MFEKIRKAAETLATDVGESRRGFLGRLGQGALATAGVVAGLLVLPKDAEAGRACRCVYSCPNGSVKLLNKQACSDCPATHEGCPLEGCSCGG